jgi:uncharacterized membrane protein
MIEGLYAMLAALGFSHPLHPMLVHVPMGMVIGAVVFSLASYIWKNHNLDQTAFHCAVVALLAVIPTIIAGILDWQQYFSGELELLIVVKFILAFLFTVLLASAVVLKIKGAEQKKVLIIYLLCLACAGGLGYSGGELVYG